MIALHGGSAIPVVDPPSADGVLGLLTGLPFPGLPGPTGTE